MHDALRYDLQQEVRMLWHKDRDLSDFTEQDCIVLPGGFSYGDYLRCGAIARFSPMMQSVIEFAGRGGKVFGVCNGFQILCESQLLPGALLRNAQQQFVCSNTFFATQRVRSIKYRWHMARVATMLPKSCSIRLRPTARSCFVTVRRMAPLRSSPALTDRAETLPVSVTLPVMYLG